MYNQLKKGYLGEIRQFVKSIDKNIHVGFTNGGSCVYIAINTIYYDLDSDEILLAKLMQEQFNTQIPEPLLIILHEVGHIMTHSEDLQRERAILLSLMQGVYNFGPTQGNKIYMNIEAERVATEWAINYYNSNKEKCDKLLEVIYEAE